MQRKIGGRTVWHTGFALTVLVMGIVYGFVSTQQQWLAARELNEIRLAFAVVLDNLNDPWYMEFPPASRAIIRHSPAAENPGLVLIAGVAEDQRNFVRVIDRDGAVVYEWRPDWFTVWPERPAGIPQERYPKREPGAMLHGVYMLDDGDLLVNFELLSTFRMSPCGKPVWKLDNLGHHFISPANDGTFWVGSERFYAEQSEIDVPNHAAPLDSWSVQQIDKDGHILQEKAIFDLLRENGLLGLLFMSNTNNTVTTVGGDTLHLNDAEVFPADMPSGVFAPGDLMISLRNINTIIVVDPMTWRIKFRSTGKVLRQHDPDFENGDRITVYDNRNVEQFAYENQKHSRIVEIDARTGASSVLVDGAGETGYYAPTMGRHQRLANGNMMLLSAWQGRALEIDADGHLVWEYFNRVRDDNTALLTEAQVLPARFDRAFFERLGANCATGAGS